MTGTPRISDLGRVLMLAGAAATTGVGQEREPTRAPQPRVTASWDSASLADVVAGFALYSGKSIVLGRDVEGVVTAQIVDQPWDVALRAILEAHGLAAEESPPGLIRVESRAAIAARAPVEPLRTTVVRLSYARAASVAAVVRAILTSRGRVAADTASNSLIVTDTEASLRWLCGAGGAPAPLAGRCLLR